MLVHTSLCLSNLERTIGAVSNLLPPWGRILPQHETHMVPHLQPGTRYHDTLHLPVSGLGHNSIFIRLFSPHQFISYITALYHSFVRCSNHFPFRLWRMRCTETIIIFLNFFFLADACMYACMRGCRVDIYTHHRYIDFRNIARRAAPAE